MLVFHERIAFHEHLIVLNGIDIHVTEFFDGVLDGGDLLFHLRDILQRLISHGGCIV